MQRLQDVAGGSAKYLKHNQPGEFSSQEVVGDHRNGIAGLSKLPVWRIPRAVVIASDRVIEELAVGIGSVQAASTLHNLKKVRQF